MTTALSPTRRLSSPSPAGMPRRRQCSQVTAQPFPVTQTSLPVDVTVRTLADFFRPGHATYLACASVHGTHSPVVAGNRPQVVQSLAQWISRRPELVRSPRPVQVRLHPNSSRNNRFPVDARYLETGFASAGLIVPGVLTSGEYDTTTLTALAGGVPDTVTLVGTSGRIPAPPKFRKVLAGRVRRTEAERHRHRFSIRARYTGKWWSDPRRPLLVSDYPDLDERPEHIDVYTDASCVPGSPWSAVGISCPDLGVVASTVLARPFIKDSAYIRVAETAGIAAGVMLFCDSARSVTVHSDSRPALRWWADTGKIPGCWSELRTFTAHEKDSHRHVDARWVKGHADCVGNLWADRAARLSLHSARWGEDERVRREKFGNLAAEFRQR